MQNDILINNLQSLFQLFTAIYFIAEWVSVERIIEYYRRRHSNKFRYRLKVKKRYSKDLSDLFSGYEEDAWYPFSISHPMGKVNFLRKVCLLFSTVCFVGLILSSMNTGWMLSLNCFIAIVLALLIPFYIALFKVIIPLERDYRKITSSIDKILHEVEVKIEQYMSIHPEPSLWFTLDTNSSDDKATQFKRHMESRRMYFSELEKHMREN
jgi:hypothetical protein